ncbi:MAG: hypothetical protein MZU95_14085 [Desulfomicrobium escambiense]|nr:hypothetical protein [Desulfomicrobium escambiense]
MFIILLFIILVAAFSIISTLIMMVMEKRKEIAILKSMGATTEQILKIFITVGMAIGISGTLGRPRSGPAAHTQSECRCGGDRVHLQDPGDAQGRVLYHGSAHQGGRG